MERPGMANGSSNVLLVEQRLRRRMGSSYLALEARLGLLDAARMQFSVWRR